MQDGPEIVVEADRDSFAYAAEGADGLVFEGGCWWGEGAEEEGAGYAEVG